MKAAEFQIPSEVDDRLREWAAYFKDRQRLCAIGSAETRYKPHSEDYAVEGWGDPEAAPTPPPRPRNWVLRAIEVQDVLSTMSKSGNKIYSWALTYAYAYPGLPRHLTLRLMRKFAGRHLTWSAYLDVVDIGRMRVHSMLSKV